MDGIAFQFIPRGPRLQPQTLLFGPLPRFGVLYGRLGVSSCLPLLEELGLLKPGTVFSRLNFA